MALGQKLWNSVKVFESQSRTSRRFESTVEERKGYGTTGDGLDICDGSHPSEPVYQLCRMSLTTDIQAETGCRVQIKGLGSGFMETETGREAEEPMHISMA
jgi:hypothetical protein